MLAELAVHRLDIVLSDAPVSPTVHVRAFNHLLGECGLTFFSKADLAAKYRRKFPSSLEKAPSLVPTERTESGDPAEFPALSRDRQLTNQESVDLYLAPRAGSEVVVEIDKSRISQSPTR